MRAAYRRHRARLCHASTSLHQGHLVVILVRLFILHLLTTIFCPLTTSLTTLLTIYLPCTTLAASSFGGYVTHLYPSLISFLEFYNNIVCLYHSCRYAWIFLFSLLRCCDSVGWRTSQLILHMWLVLGLGL